MNTLINNGHHTDELLNYLDQLHVLIGDDIPIENEIVKAKKLASSITRPNKPRTSQLP